MATCFAGVYVVKTFSSPYVVRAWVVRAFPYTVAYLNLQDETEAQDRCPLLSYEYNHKGIVRDEPLAQAADQHARDNDRDARQPQQRNPLFEDEMRPDDDADITQAAERVGITQFQVRQGQ